jgi:hypothetical protein
MSKNYQVYEGEENSVYSELKTNTNIVVGDTIEYITNNQMGYEKYKVILNEKGEKNIKIIDSYDNQIGLYD